MQAVAKVGVKWSDFQLTDNSCRAAESRLEEIENDLMCALAIRACAFLCSFSLSSALSNRSIIFVIGA
eukprot:112154-Pleurochrysis_carterae.AAC.1